MPSYKSYWTVSLNVWHRIPFCLFLLPDFIHSCSYCKTYHTSNIDDILEHCKLCSLMPRPNSYKCKFVCYMSTCSYVTYHKQTMQAHIFSHMGEKPFKCPICDYSCNLKTNLNKHLQNSHGRMFWWSICKVLKIINCWKIFQ